MSKNPFNATDFLTINEFSKLVGISTDSLRHYDRIELFTPVERGGRYENKYRYYSPTQIPEANLIRILTGTGTPLETIRELIQDRTLDKMIKLFSQNRNRLTAEIRFKQEVLSVINARSEMLLEAVRKTETDISIEEMPEERIILGDTTDPSSQTDYLDEYIRFCNAPHVPTLNLSYPVGGYFENMAAYSNEPSRPARLFSLDPKGNERKEAGLFLIGYSRGNYGQANDLPERMSAFAKNNDLIFDGSVYSVLIIDEISETNPENYLLRVFASIRETRHLPPNHHYRRS